jgi:allophanate hydrolase subunit 2
VLPESNRIGVRLEGQPLVRRTGRVGEELDSEPTVLGAVQVPPSGQPVVLLADHATTGGYPVIGVVRDVGVLAQARPGDVVSLRPAR